MSSNGLTVCKSTEFSILASAGLFCLLHKGAVECSSLPCKRAILLVCKFKLAFDSHITGTVPVRTKVLSEILYGIHIVITYHEPSLGRLHITKLTGEPHIAVFSNCGNCILLCSSHIERAPVDTVVVTLLSEDILLDARSLEIYKTVLRVCVRHGGLVTENVYSPGRCSLKDYLHIVFLSVKGLHLVRHIVYRA